MTAKEDVGDGSVCIVHDGDPARRSCKDHNNRNWRHTEILKNVLCLKKTKQKTKKNIANAQLFSEHYHGRILKFIYLVSIFLRHIFLLAKYGFTRSNNFTLI